MYYQPGHEAWMASDGAGIAATYWETFRDSADDDGEAEAASIDAEIAASIRSGAGEEVSVDEINSNGVKSLLESFEWA